VNNDIWSHGMALKVRFSRRYVRPFCLRSESAIFRVGVPWCKGAAQIGLGQRWPLGALATTRLEQINFRFQEGIYCANEPLFDFLSNAHEVRIVCP